MTAPLEAVAARLRGAGGLLAAATADPSPGAPAPLGEAAAEGVARRGLVEHAGEYALLIEAIREGHLAHYAEGRVLRSDDADLRLLAGDHLYALGLDRLAELGDVESVAVLAEVIARCARAHAEGRPEDADRAWLEGVAAVADRAVPRGSGVGPNT